MKELHVHERQLRREVLVSGKNELKGLFGRAYYVVQVAPVSGKNELKAILAGRGEASVKYQARMS